MNILKALIKFFVFIGTVLFARAQWLKPFSIKLFYERVFFSMVIDDPELLSHLRLFDKFGINFYNAYLTDISYKRHKKLVDICKRDLLILKSYNQQNITENLKLSKDLLEWNLKESIEADNYYYHSFPVNQLFGIQNHIISFMIDIHQINDILSARHYISRLRRVPYKIGQLIDLVSERQKRGFIPPKFVIEKSIEQIKAFLLPEPSDNILVKNLEEKLRNVVGSLDEKEKLLKQAKIITGRYIYKAYKSLLNVLLFLNTRADEKAGLWKFKNGEEYYAFLLKSNTTLDLLPEQIHEIGLKEVDRIIKEMQSVIKETGSRMKDVKKFMLKMNKSKKFIYPDTSSGKKAILSDYSKIIQNISDKIHDLFDFEIDTKIEVKPIPEFRAKSAARAYYMPGSLDGKRKGCFYVNLLMNQHKFRMETLAYHEAIPGHHLQIAMQRKLKDMPTFRKILTFPAYVEGWALYAEKLAYEHGFISDAYSNLGRLENELFRAIRLVVDTGIHFKKWSKEKALDYMVKLTARPVENLVAEVERYVVLPAQACSYKIGELKILELREKAKKALKEKFSLKDFHSIVLKNGSIPLKLLEKQVEEWNRGTSPKTVHEAGGWVLSPKTSELNI